MSSLNVNAWLEHYFTCKMIVKLSKLTLVVKVIPIGLGCPLLKELPKFTVLELEVVSLLNVLQVTIIEFILHFKAGK